VRVELSSGLVVIALNGCLFQDAVEALDLALGPGTGGFSQLMLHAEGSADAGKVMPTWKPLMRLHKLYEVVGQYRMRLVGQLLQHSAEEVGRYHSRGLGLQLGKSHFARAVDSDENARETFSSAQTAFPRAAVIDSRHGAENNGAGPSEVQDGLL
jgi:hypothetical protein